MKQSHATSAPSRQEVAPHAGARIELRWVSLNQSEKIAAIRAIYDGPRTADGQIHVGWPFGGEDDPGGWGGWMTGTGQQPPGAPPSLAFGFGVEVMRHMVEHDPGWRFEGFDFTGFRHRFRAGTSTGDIHRAALRRRSRSGEVRMPLKAMLRAAADTLIIHTR